jgi:shikimate kinase
MTPWLVDDGLGLVPALRLRYNLPMEKNIFMIGPASVGKSTVGELLAGKIGYHFVDIDMEFCGRIQLIPDYINEFGYVSYCEANAELVDELLRENSARTVFATPAGYLVHETASHVAEKNRGTISGGISVLRLPAEDPDRGVQEIVRRQLYRWNDAKEHKEREKFLARHEKDKNYGDIKIFSFEGPEIVAAKVVAELTRHFL